MLCMYTVTGEAGSSRRVQIPRAGEAGFLPISAENVSSEIVINSTSIHDSSLLIEWASRSLKNSITNCVDKNP